MMNSFPPFLCIYFACIGEVTTLEKKKNLCAMIPESLHARVREEQTAMEISLGEYVEKIIREHFEKGEETMAGGTRTLALQMPEDLFIRIKAYLNR